MDDPGDQGFLENRYLQEGSYIMTYIYIYIYIYIWEPSVKAGHKFMN